MAKRGQNRFDFFINKKAMVGCRMRPLQLVPAFPEGVQLETKCCTVKLDCVDMHRKFEINYIACPGIRRVILRDECKDWSGYIRGCRSHDKVSEWMTSWSVLSDH